MPKAKGGQPSEKNRSTETTEFYRARLGNLSEAATYGGLMRLGPLVAAATAPSVLLARRLQNCIRRRHHLKISGLPLRQELTCPECEGDFMQRRSDQHHVRASKAKHEAEIAAGKRGRFEPIPFHEMVME
jgi:hypothetical protein